MLVVMAAVLALAGCTSAPSSPAPPTRTITTVVGTRTPSPIPAFTPAPATSVRPLPYGKKPPKGEVAKACPYLRTGLDEDPTSEPNVADIEGDRIYRTTVLTAYRPVGCRFYFYAPPYEATADILPTTFPTAAAAHNALVRTAALGTNQSGQPNFVPGVDGIRYRTKFFGPDGARDWAFAFAKGTVLVVVHTQQNDSELNAQLLGEAIVGKF